MTANANKYLGLIRMWAGDRNLIEGSTPRDQFLKTIEEVGELANGIGKIDEQLIMDGIGDVVVTLTILAAQFNLKIEDCIAYAYDEIKDRKGRMENGMFVKEVA